MLVPHASPDYGGAREFTSRCPTLCRVVSDSPVDNDVPRFHKDTAMADTKPPGKSPSPDNAYTQWYEVKSGDTLWKIAKEHYGDGSLYTDIFKANQDVLKDPDKIKVGQKLRLP